MDKIKKYQKTILDYLHEYAEDMYSRDKSGLETEIVVDKENHHYQLVRVGWSDDRFSHYCPLHFDIKDGKIWLQVNNTEELVAEELVKRGIPPSDIVLGFHHKEMRPYTGFAVA